MSINVTVNGNPVSIRRGRMVLSDLDQIKKNERDRRRKLRLEQVREQSKQISNRLLERAKNVTKAQLTQLEKDGRSELRQIHDRKILDLQRKYQEDMEDIGRAHTSASLQPDIEALLEADRKKNRFLAVERGKEAMQRLKETNLANMENENAALHERQRLVREMENARASMIANLPKKSLPINESDRDSDSVGQETVRKSPKKKRDKKANKFQKAIPKVVVESSDLQVVVSDPKAKRFEPLAGPSGIITRKMDGDSKRSNASSKTVTDISEFPRVSACCESDDQEPRKSLPTFNSPSKADKVASYNPEDYKPGSSSSGSSTSGSTSLSDDSSYFSDGAIVPTVRKKTPRHTTSAASSKVQLYDHNTRQRNAYDKPVGIVERININGEPNAEELAHTVAESENVDSRLAETRRRDAARRGNDAILRDKVRQDYKNLLENLDHLAREERKLKASQIHGPPFTDIHLNPARRQELIARRQRNMDRAFEANFRDGSSAVMDDDRLRPLERVVTTAPIDEAENAVSSTPSAVWHEPPFFEPSSNVAEEEEESVDRNEKKISRNEQILDMLRKVERQKRLLLKEFGADLPDEIFTASVKPLFGENVSEKPIAVNKKAKPSMIPEIKVINLSSCDENDKIKSSKKVLRKKTSSPPKGVEIAVQTSTLDEKGAVGMDKSVQVELINSRRSSGGDSTGEEKIDGKNLLRENIIEGESNSGSSDSVEAGIVIDIKKKRVRLTPRKKRSNVRISRGNSPRVVAKPRSVPGGKAATPVKRPSRSAPVSKQSTPRSNISNVQPIRITEKKVKIELDKGGIKVKINPSLNSESLSRDESTESSKSTPSEASKERIVGSKNQGKIIRDNSDTSTSYTSPPPPTPASYRSARNNSTPILEILENSESENTKLKKRNISPVSSPGTPSPRTINLPTNTPHSRQINRVLEYYDSTVSQSTDNTISLSLPGRQSTPNEVPIYLSKKRDASERSDKPSDVCSCVNPQCKLLHLNMRDVDDQTLKNYPEILRKYEDLQSMCTDRIASLTDLIEKVRGEQKGMELSIGGQSDESSMFLTPGPAPVRGDLHSVRKLVDSIEAVHNQLAKTIDESQRIIGAKKGSEESSKSTSSSTRRTIFTETDENSPITSGASADGGQSSANDFHQGSSGRGIPRIISSERVNIPLTQFKLLPKQKTGMKISVDESTSPSRRKSPRQEEDVVERLSKEILEQSKALDNISSESSPKKNDFDDSRSPTGRKSPSPKKHREISPNSQDQSGLRDGIPEKDLGFVPLLAGIPKVQRMPPTLSENRRPKPPVTLIHGPHRVQTGSPGHELSTIVEFDTPDTASKSQRSVRSPTRTDKSRKNLVKNYQSLSGEPPSSPPTRSRSPIRPSSSLAELAAATTTPESPSKRSEASSALPTTQTTAKQQISSRDAGTSGSCDSAKKCEKSTCPKSVAKLPLKPQISVEVSGTQTEGLLSRKEGSSDSSCSIPDISAEFTKRNLIFHARMAATAETGTAFRPKESRQQITSVSTEADKEKITSTSSNSFSGLSGISEITSTPTSDILKYTSSPEEMETALKKLGLGWAITTLKKTREASALSSSSNSDTTPINPSRKLISPSVKKDIQVESKINCFPNLSDVSSISIKDANKSTERGILLKARTSTPNIEQSNSSCEKHSSSTTNNSSRGSIQDQSDSLTAPNLSLTTKKSPPYDKQLNGA